MATKRIRLFSPLSGALPLATPMNICRPSGLYTGGCLNKEPILQIIQMSEQTDLVNVIKSIVFCSTCSFRASIFSLSGSCSHWTWWWKQHKWFYFCPSCLEGARADMPNRTQSHSVALRQDLHVSGFLFLPNLHHVLNGDSLEWWVSLISIFLVWRYALSYELG